MRSKGPPAASAVGAAESYAAMICERFLLGITTCICRGASSRTTSRCDQKGRQDQQRPASSDSYRHSFSSLETVCFLFLPFPCKQPSRRVDGAHEQPDKNKYADR